MSTSVVLGNSVTFRWCFTTRALTEVEREAFVAGKGLPAGIGHDPTKVKFEQTPEGGATTSTEAGVVKDAVGAYHYVLTPSTEGTLRWRGLGLNGASEIVEATPYEALNVEGKTTGRVAAILTAIMTEGNFDVTEAAALRWATQAHRLLCVRSLCIRKRLDIGPTVAEQSNYELPVELLQIKEVTVAGVPFGTGKHPDIAGNALHYIWITGYPGTGVTAPDSTPGGAEQIALVPTPSESGLPINVYCVCRPGQLVVGDDTTLGCPVEFDDTVIAGAIATGLEREAMRPDLAASYRQTFEAGCTELLKQVRRRHRGPGPTTIRIHGYND